MSRPGLGDSPQAGWAEILLTMAGMVFGPLAATLTAGLSASVLSRDWQLWLILLPIPSVFIGFFVGVYAGNRLGSAIDRARLRRKQESSRP
jgi:hypothetical protein